MVRYLAIPEKTGLLEDRSVRKEESLLEGVSGISDEISAAPRQRHVYSRCGYRTASIGLSPLIMKLFLVLRCCLAPRTMNGLNRKPKATENLSLSVKVR